MTTTTLSTGEAPPGAPARQDRDAALESFVATRVLALQRAYLAGESGGVGALARLRRAVTSAPGADPQVWGDVLAGMPDELLGRGDDPSPYERAAHAAITGYAVHQQSQSQSMHRAGRSLGAAIRALGQGHASEEAVRRRFQALGTASSWAETLHHLRGLLTQLRGAGIALDHGRLARDLRRLQQTRTADGVRLAWGRDYYRTARDGAGTPDGPAADEPTPSTENPTGDQ